MPGILSIGWYLPQRRRSVAEIAARTGIAQSTLVDFGVVSQTAPGERDHPAGMAAAAARHALDAAGLSAEEVDLVIFCGMTHDYPSPWVTAFGVMHELGAAQATGFDLSARCPGLLDALWVAAQLIAAGSHRTALVCTGDRFDHLLGPPRVPNVVGEAMYSAGGAAAVVSRQADNELIAFTHNTNKQLELHSQNIPRAGGTRMPLTGEALDSGLHRWQSGMTLPQLATVVSFMRTADRRNLDALRRLAGFDEIDFLICSPIDVHGQSAALAELGLDPVTQTLFTIPVFGHMGPADALVSLAAAIAEGRRVGPRLVLAARSVISSNAIAVRGQREDLGIRVTGSPLDEIHGAAP